VQEAGLLQLTTHEVVDSPKSALSAILSTMRGPSSFNVVKDMVKVGAVVLEEVKDDLLQSLAGLISTPSMEPSLVKSVIDTRRKDFAFRVTKRRLCHPLPGVEGQGVGRHAQQA
jgi:hypothetical protein